MGEVGWTTPEDLPRQVRWLWDRGVILTSLRTEETRFPRRLVLGRPGSTGLRDRFDEVRAWVAAVRSMPHVCFTMHEIRHSVSGANLLSQEAHRGVLGELLDLALPPTSIDAGAPAGVAGFSRRYGFREKPERIRFRMLDPAHALLPAAGGAAPEPDVTLDAASFAALDAGVSRVFVTENEINFLAFPRVRQGMVIFGAGYGFETLGGAHWLRRCRLHYWGDIDTHGFAILDALRARFGHVESFLMDRSTLLAFESLWSTEDSPIDRELPRLTAEERALYYDLRVDRFGRHVRLEQERIGFGWVRDALVRL